MAELKSSVVDANWCKGSMGTGTNGRRRNGGSKAVVVDAYRIAASLSEPAVRVEMSGVGLFVALLSVVWMIWSRVHNVQSRNL